MPPTLVQQPTPSTHSPRPIDGGPVVASSDNEKVKQLVALLRSELDGSGQLSTIKAQLASTASSLVLRKSSSSLKASTSQIPEPTLSILAECLSHYGFRHSLNTLLAESGVSRDRLSTRPQLAKHIGVADIDGKESGSLLDILSNRSPTSLINANASSATTFLAPSAAANPIGSTIRSPPPALAPLGTGGPLPTPSATATATVAAPPAAHPTAKVLTTTSAPSTSSPPTQPSTLANAAATRPHTAPPLTPLPPTPPKVSAKDISPPQPSTLAPLAHPITVRSQALDPEPPRSIGASPHSPGNLDLSQISSVPSQITSEDLGLSGGSSPASTSVLSTEDYSVSVSVAQAGGMGGEFRGLGLEKRGQVGAWLADKEFHMKP